MLSERYLDAIKSFEGFTARATHDYAQLSNGYGTKARYAGEIIDRVEAERRFREEISESERLVDQFVSGLDEGTKAALTSLTYNTGTRWMQSGLGESVKRGDLDAAADIIKEYTRAGGEVLNGLVARREQEATWIGGGASVTSTQMASAEAPRVSTNSMTSRPAEPRLAAASPVVMTQVAAAAPSSGAVEVKSAIAERLVFLGLQTALGDKDDSNGWREGVTNA